MPQMQVSTPRRTGAAHSVRTPSGAAPAGSVARRRLGATVGLVVAAGLMVLSLSAFVVGSNAGNTTGILVGQRAANFSARDAEGQRRTLHQFRGSPVLLLFGVEEQLSDVWRQIPTRLLPEQTQLLLLADEATGMSGGSDPAANVTLLRDENRLVARQYGIWTETAAEAPAMIQAVLISPTGEILDRGPLPDVLTLVD